MEDVLKLYREELARVKAERDAATAETRTLWAAVGLLKGATGELLGLTATAHTLAEHEEFVREETYTAVCGAARTAIERADSLLGMGE